QIDGEVMINSIKNGEHPLPVVAQVSLAGTAPNKHNCELNYKILNNLQPKWKQYGTLMRQTKNLIDINIDALYNILKQNQGDVNDAMGYKKKAVVVTLDPLALVTEKTKVSKRREKVVVQLESEGSDDEDISDLKNIIALLAKGFNRKKYYAKPTNNNLRTFLASSSANKKPEYEGHFAKDCKKAKVKDYNYYKTKMLLAKKDGDEQVILAEGQAWMESKKSSSSAEETIVEISYYSSDFESESNNSKLNKDVKRYSRKDLLSCNNSHHGDTRSAYACNDAMNVSCNSRLYASYDVNDLFVFDDIVQISLWIIDSGCSKHMTGNRALLTNFVEKFLGMVRFGNNDFSVIAGYGDVVIGSMTIKKAYYVEGLPKMKFEKDHLCSACEQRKIHRNHQKSKTAFDSNKPLYLLYMDLCGPMRVEIINRKRYVFVVVDDYSRYTWVFFLRSKDEASKFFDEVRITQQFSAARTPQQNGVVERRN
nr:hypothetical protein [Tanacetum cinerariifolium]